MRLARLLGILLLLATPALARPALERSLPPQQAAAELEALRQEVRDSVARGERPIVMFDLDDTLLHGQPSGMADPNGKALAGAVAYVKQLIADGASIVYVTGRPRKLRRETIRHLRTAGFPMGRAQKLLLNPYKSWRLAVRWKARAVALVRRFGIPLAAFDNEKDNVRMYRRKLPPQARVFRLNTKAVMPDPGRGAKGIRVISDFRRR